MKSNIADNDPQNFLVPRSDSGSSNASGIGKPGSVQQQRSNFRVEGSAQASFATPDEAGKTCATPNKTKTKPR